MLGRPGIVLVVLVACSAAGRAVAGLGIEGLWVVPDEMIYASLGRNLWDDGELRIVGGHSAVYSLLFPALVGLPIALLGYEPGLDAARAVEAVVMSLAAVPVYLWSRRLGGAAWALVAAAFTLAVPALVYTGLIMSETLFYPLTAAAAWAAAGALERPTALRQALVVGALLAALLTRLQAFALVLAFALAVVTFALLRRRAGDAARLWPALGALALLGAGWVAYRTVAAGSPLGALGAYAAVGETSYDPVAVLRFAVYHAADLMLLTAVVPVVAVALLAVEAARKPAAPRALHAYVAVAVSFVATTLAVVGAFASEHVGLLFERAAVGVAPVLFVGLAAWLGRGAPRPRLVTGVVAVAALALFLLVPLREVVVWETLQDSFGLVPLLELREAAGLEAVELAAWGAVATVLALVALLPRRALSALVVGLLAWPAYASYAATERVALRAAHDQRHLLASEFDWIDEALPDDRVDYLSTGDPVNLVWQTVFWNESVRRVYAFDRNRAGRLPSAVPVRARADGVLVDPDGEPLPSRYAVASADRRFAGEVVSEVGTAQFGQRGLRVWRLDGPPRFTWWVSRVRPDGDFHEPGVVHAYRCGGGRLELTLLPKLSSRVELRLNGTTVQTLEVAGREVAHAVVPVPEPVVRCRFEIVPDSLLGSTRIEFLYPSD